MRYLLDTHALLWALTSPDRLGDEARRVISAHSNEIVVSAASAWEIATKFRIGKLPHADAIVHGFGHHLNRLAVGQLPITADHALFAGTLDWAHRDPFDRMLAAQALIESVTLITMDAAFGDVPSLATIW